MIFNSIEFLIFLPCVLVLYFILTHRAQNVLLLGASYAFYGFWDWRFLSLILVSTFVDFFVGRALGRAGDPRVRKQLLTISLVANLGILGFFKYFDFFVVSAVDFIELIGFTAHEPTLRILLPVGISFYTFQTLSYTLDVYRREMKPTNDLLSFALFVAFFPQLVAGPIERARRLLPVLSAPRTVSWPGIAVGLELILIGFFKKVGIADTVAPLVDARFFDPTKSSGQELLLGAYLFSIQIYCDFSGYSDIARGTARLFGVPLMRNFEQPYLSRSITEFWRRWHISLSSWLRDYLYISLGGNRGGRFKTYRNLMLTMLLGGLWHGASWTFVIWGGIHGLYLALHKWLMELRGIKRPSPPNSIVGNLIAIIVTFNLVTLTWVFFRADSLEIALTYFDGILAWQPASAGVDRLEILSPRLLILIAGLLVIDIWQARRGDHALMLSWHGAVRSFGYASLLIGMFLLANLNENIPFIYFQF